MVAKVMRQLTTIAVASVLFFWVGWDMGQENYKKQAIECLRSGNMDEVSVALAAWSKRDPSSVRRDPIFYISCAAVHSKNGNHDACKYNLEAAIKLLEK